ILAVYITIHLRYLAHYRRSPCLPGMSLAPAQRSHPATSVARTTSSTMGPIPWRIVRRCLRSFVHWYNVAVLHAGVAELVDAPDSKSGGAKAPCRFEPDLRYSGYSCKQGIFSYRWKKALGAVSEGFGSNAAAIGYDRASSIAAAA